MKKSIVVLLMAFVLVSLAVPMISARSAQAATSTADFDRAVNTYILSQASCWELQQGGQCKTWVQQVVWNASGRYLFNYCSADSYWPKRWLPATQSTLVRWNPASFTVVVASGIRNISSAWWLMKPGMIIQCAHNALGGTTPHTMIVKTATSGGLTVIDSNWYSDGVVHSHFVSKTWLDAHVLGWTLYQIR